MTTKIFHLSDIHIRIYQRHGEYINVFDSLFDSIKQEMDSDSIAIVTGDIVHSKLNTSAEMFRVLHYFLKGLSDILPTYIILGNHDLNLKNKSRLDPVSPVIKAINSSNLKLLSGTELHELPTGLRVSLLDVVDGDVDFVKHDSISSNGEPVVAVYHGIVEGAMASTGFELDGEMPLELFRGFDAVLLGDVHRYQELSHNLLYPGSLIQQNFGESPRGHGYVVWDWEGSKFTHKFVEVFNKHSFLVLDFSLPISEITSYINNSLTETTERLSLSIRNQNKVDPEVGRRLILELSSRYDIVKMEKKSSVIDSVELDINNINDYSFKDKNSSAESIGKYLKDNFDIPDNLNSEIEGIVTNLIEEYNGWTLSSTDDIKVESFEFNNMFSYGSQVCYVNFTSFKGLTGIFAQNAAGKSTFFDALAFSIFGKSSRTSKASEVLNSTKDDFQSKVILRKGSDRYLIAKTGSKSKSGRVSVSIDFKRIDDDGKELESLVGQDRRETEKNIKDIFGSFEDFSQTSFYAQSDNINFIELGQAARKNLLSYYLNLDLFNEWYNELREELKKVKSILDYDDIDSHSTSELTLLSEINDLKSEKELIEVTLEKVRKDIEKTQQSIESKYSNLKEVSGVESIDVELTKRKISDRRSLVENLRIKAQETKENSLTIEETLRDLGELTPVENPESKVFSYNQEISSLNNSIKIHENNIKNIENRLSEFDNLEYDPDCKFCVQNLNIGKIDELKEQAEEYKSKISEDKEKIKSFERLIDGLQEDISNYQVYKSKEDEKASLVKQRALILTNLSDTNSLMESVNHEIDSLEQKVAHYLTNKDNIVHNEKVRGEIQTLKELESKQSKDRDSLLSRFSQIGTLVESKATQLAEVKEKIKKIMSLETRKNSLEYLVKATHRDGLPMDIISNALPFIQNVVNDILSDYVDFRVNVTQTNKDVDVTIQYEDGTCWDATLTSGMEKFLLSLSFRVALNELTTLNKFNVLIIDEGFGSLDFDKRSSIEGFLNRLKNHYNHIFCISHIDSMKDYMDNLMTVSKDSGYSKLYLDA